MTMKTRPKLTDDEWLAKFEAGEIEVDLSTGSELTDLAEVRAYELLHREYEAAITGSIRLSRHRGARWSDIADAVGLSEADAIATYRAAIGPEAEATASSVEPEEPADTRMTAFLVRCRDDADARLAEAVKRASEAGVHADFIRSVRTRTEEDARFAWPFPS